MKILVAEDDASTALTLTRALEMLGHEVLGARDGQEAWKIFAAQEPPLVVTDWIMPGLEGPDLIRRIRAAPRKRYTYIVLLTVLSGTGKLIEGLDAGADDFITKPLDREQLRARLHVAERVLALQGEMLQLQSLLSMCCYCKKIRDDDGSWGPLDRYLVTHTDASISHAVCETCLEAHFPDDT